MPDPNTEAVTGHWRGCSPIRSCARASGQRGSRRRAEYAWERRIDALEAFLRRLAPAGDPCGRRGQDLAIDRPFSRQPVPRDSHRRLAPLRGLVTHVFEVGEGECRAKVSADVRSPIGCSGSTPPRAMSRWTSVHRAEQQRAAPAAAWPSPRAHSARAGPAAQPVRRASRASGVQALHSSLYLRSVLVPLDVDLGRGLGESRGLARRSVGGTSRRRRGGPRRPPRRSVRPLGGSLGHGARRPLDPPAGRETRSALSLGIPGDERRQLGGKRLGDRRLRGEQAWSVGRCGLEWHQPEALERRGVEHRRAATQAAMPFPLADRRKRQDVLGERRPSREV